MSLLNGLRRYLMLRSVFRPLARTRPSLLRSLHNPAPRFPFATSQWSEPTGDGLVPIVVEQTVCFLFHSTFQFPSQTRDSRTGKR